MELVAAVELVRLVLGAVVVLVHDAANCGAACASTRRKMDATLLALRSNDDVDRDRAIGSTNPGNVDPWWPLVGPNSAHYLDHMDVQGQKRLPRTSQRVAVMR